MSHLERTPSNGLPGGGNSTRLAGFPHLTCDDGNYARRGSVSYVNRTAEGSPSDCEGHVRGDAESGRNGDYVVNLWKRNNMLKSIPRKNNMEGEDEW